MSLPAEIRPSHLSGDSRITATYPFSNFSDFKKDTSNIYDSVTALFVDTYNAPPWDEEWSKDSAGKYFDKLMSLPSQVTTIQEGKNLLGFFIGCIGYSSDVVPLSVKAYFPEESDDVNNEMQKRIFSKLELLDDNEKELFWGCDFAVPPEKRGAIVAGKLLREAIRYPLTRGITDMYGMTMVGSPFHTITERRGSKMLLEVKEILPENPRVFKIMDMRGLTQ